MDNNRPTAYGFLAASLAAVLLAACAAPASKSSTSKQGTAVPAQKYKSENEALKAARPDDLICTYERRTGSNLRQQVCKTAQQREDERRAAQDAAVRTRGGTLGGNNEPSVSLGR